MKKTIFVLCALMFVLVSLAHGQPPFCAVLMETDQQLDYYCQTGHPLPDGTVIRIMQDLDPPGVGPEDAPAVVGVPPNCVPGTVNFSAFQINGNALGLLPGQFYTDNAFCSCNMLPDPNRFYLRVDLMYQHYVSQVFSPPPGFSEIEMGPWTCYTDPPCDPYPADRMVWLEPTYPFPGHQDDGACITLCHAYPTVMVAVGPLGTDRQDAMSRRPNVTAGDGCDCQFSAMNYIWNGAFGGPWVLTLVNGQYYYEQPITLPENGLEGCVYLHLDFALPVQMGAVEIVPLDNAVSVHWTTVSESNLSRFEILRDGARIGDRAATNTATGADYHYVDNSALNGTTYRYELVVVSTDGARETVAAKSVTPGTVNATVSAYALHANYPNPFNPSTTIRFDLPEQGPVILKVYDITGKVVATLLNGPMAAGAHTVQFDGSHLPSGVYLCAMSAGSFHATQKMLLVR